MLISIGMAIGRLAETTVDHAGYIQPVFATLHFGDRSDAHQGRQVVTLTIGMRVAGGLGLVLDSRLLHRRASALAHCRAIGFAVAIAEPIPDELAEAGVVIAVSGLAVDWMGVLAVFWLSEPVWDCDCCNG